MGEILGCCWNSKRGACERIETRQDCLPSAQTRTLLIERGRISPKFQQLATIHASSWHPMLEFAGYDAVPCPTEPVKCSGWVSLRITEHRPCRGCPKGAFGCLHTRTTQAGATDSNPTVPSSLDLFLFAAVGLPLEFEV